MSENKEKFLKDRVALVTGGASGMGLAMAIEFAKAGARIAIGSLLSSHRDSLKKGELVYLPGEEELLAAKQKLEALGVEVLAQNLDVTSSDSAKNFFEEAIKKFDRVDILANAAGITAEQTVCGHTDELWDRVIDVNLNGTFRMTRLCLPEMMKRKWGRIINIASTAASVGASTSAAYCAAKAGVVGFTRCVAIEGAEHKVTCNSISPTWVETQFGVDWMSHISETQEGRSGQEYMKEVRSSNPQKRMIQPSEIGNLAVFLCRDESLGITMQDLTV